MSAFTPRLARTALFSALLAASLSATAQSTEDGVFHPAQALRGSELYLQSCVECHGLTLRGGEAGPALVGTGFWNKWRGQSLAAFYQITASTMPVNNPNGFSPQQYADLVAFILQQNGLPSDSELELPASAAELVSIVMAEPTTPLRVASLLGGSGGTQRVVDAEWLGYHNDSHATRYAPLDHINPDNVQDLEIVWRWYSANHGPNPEFNYEATPIMADGVLYVTAGRRRDVVAIDPVTGETLWMYRLDEGARRGPRVNSGRGLSLWRQDGVSRLLNVTPGYQLVALDPVTGQPDPAFGEQGIVDLKVDLEDRFEIAPEDIPVGLTSPPMIVGDVIVIGATFPSGGSPASRQQAMGSIRGYDVRSGELLWKFHTIPQAGEFGVESWRDNSWQYSGQAGAWATMAADQERGIVYVPVEAATGDMYGGHRPGDNLFSQSLVALDVKTGERLWHFQLVHHDVWDYDPPTAPVLAELRVNGQDIPAAIQVTKQGMVYTFNRVTGEPVWPIVERPVPQSTIPGEQTSPTQPFPTRPAPFERLGITEDDLIDFTPELKEEAKRLIAGYTYGPLFTPPSLVTETNGGTIFMPGFGGGANWQGVAFDPESNILYVPSTSHPMKVGLGRNPEGAEFDYAMVSRGLVMEGPYGLPLVKGPWGRITAIDMNSGEHLWMVGNAETPDEIRNHPRLRGVELPERSGTGDRGGLLVTRSLLFSGEGAGLYGGQTGGGNKFTAYDKASGEVLHSVELPAKQTGLPMTYQIDGVQYIVVPVGDTGHPGELVALRVRAAR